MVFKLDANRIYLRELQESDAPALSAKANDQEVAKYTLLPQPYTLEAAKEFIESTQKGLREKTGYELCIVSKETDELIGMIGLVPVDMENKRAGFGYWLARDAWGQGIMSEAVQTMLTFGFSELGLERIAAEVYHPNTASIGLLEKFGFVHEGTKRKSSRRNGEVYDDHVYGLLKDEFLTTN